VSENNLKTNWNKKEKGEYSLSKSESENKEGSQLSQEKKVTVVKGILKERK